MALTSTPQLNTKALLTDLQKLLKSLEADLRARSEKVEDIRTRLVGQWEKEHAAGRTAATYETWRDEYLTQVAVAWILSCVFVRYMEDNRLVDEVYLAGEKDRLKRAHDTQEVYFQKHPTDSDRNYLEWVFEVVAKLPGCEDLFGKTHNALWLVPISGDAAAAVLKFWQQIVPETGALVRNFELPDGDTRFLGDLYQDLSEAARKRYALLQTPDFVESFILDRTLEPAIETFGLETVRMIDPTCGSGHFLLGGFRRLFDKWLEKDKNGNRTVLVQRALDGVAGVDLNPFAVAIARFRLLVAALRAAGVTRLAHAPDFRLHVAAGDSLLHGRRFDRTGQYKIDDLRRDGEVREHWLPDAFAVGDFEEATKILSRPYHAVVGNPPYIVDKDKAHNEAVRRLYVSCHRQFSLGAPFTERFFRLATEADHAGYVGLISSNSFIKREFGKKLIEEFLPTVDLTHVIDTSGAYIPGHGTPTVILFGRSRSPRLSVVRTVMGIRGEPQTPDDPSRGKVWGSMLALADSPGQGNEFLSVSDMRRETLGKHPWSMGGGGAAELKDRVEGAASSTLQQVIDAIGRTNVLGEEDIWIFDRHTIDRIGISAQCVGFVVGESVRDWSIIDIAQAIYPYDALGGNVLLNLPASLSQYLWQYRTLLENRTVFGKGFRERGLPWYEHLEHYRDRLRTPLSITFAFFSTHNHFVLDRGGKLFNRSAPIIKLPTDRTENEHLELLGLLNSSTACFWIHQVCHNKGAGADQSNARQTAEAFDNFFEISATQIAKFPVISSPPILSLAGKLDTLAEQRQMLAPEEVLAKALPSDFATALMTSRRQDMALRERSIFLQEEIDWQAYIEYGIVPADAAASVVYSDRSERQLKTGHRAFEVVLWRAIQEDGETSSWFSRMQCASPDEAPDDAVLRRRVSLITANPSVGLIEQPEYKRRWLEPSWDERQDKAVRVWLLTLLESPAYWPTPAVTSCARLADAARQDKDFMQVAALYTKRDDFDVDKLVTEMVLSEAVPFLPILRYKESGLSKRTQWERTWDLQRREDKGEDVGKIPVPPKYTSADFLNATYWRLRGKLDVPKERFILYSHCERDADRSPVVGWAGWDAKQQAQAIASYFNDMRETEGWSTERLKPLLAGVQELVPWLLQWHNDVDPETGERLGDFYQGWLDEERRSLRLTADDLKAWAPPKASSGRRRK